MDSAVIQIPTFESTVVPTANRAQGLSASEMRSPASEDLLFEIGLWLSGLESFSKIKNYSFGEEAGQKAFSRDWTREFRLTHAALLLCSKTNFELYKQIKNRDFAPEKFEISTSEIVELSEALKEAVLLNECVLRAAPLKFSEWTAWGNFLGGKLQSIAAAEKLIAAAEKIGETFLPAPLHKLLQSKNLSFSRKADLETILPHFGKILKWLSVINRMLKTDEPLKPSVLIFARIYEQIQEMIEFVNNRLSRFPNEEDELFALLDGAAYTASIELRKVFSHELINVTDIRQSPSLYAKIETSYSLLNDSFQQTLVGFAQLVEPTIKPTELFPDFQDKLQQSIVLRQNMWEILQSVRAAEKTPESSSLNCLHAELTGFLTKSMHFLFYKDMETVERFIEEVLVTENKKDLVPILHRFGAYLETLLGQINMRTVLANHPFNPQQKSADETLIKPL